MRDVKVNSFLKHSFLFYALFWCSHFSADLWETLETHLPLFPSFLIMSTRHIQESYWSTAESLQLLRREEKETMLQLFFSEKL